MKEATGEVSGTVITIVIVAAVAVLAGILFQPNGIAQNWITNVFNNQINKIGG